MDTQPGNNAMCIIKTILHPTDFSACSQAAFRLAYALARDHAARLIVLHVTAVPDLAYQGFGGPGLPLLAEQYLAKVRQGLEKLRPPDPQFPCERRLAEGDPAAEIIGAAAETAADLIVMGTHGRTGLRHLLMGSVAEQVVRQAPCPVVTLKQESADEPGP
jgi:nucleotide-binding universal stress UspA family protein